MEKKLRCHYLGCVDEASRVVVLLVVVVVGVEDDDLATEEMER